MKRFDETGGDIIYAPVQDIDDLPNDPQVSANDYVVDFNHPAMGPIRVIGFPISFSKTPGSVRREAPELGLRDEKAIYYRGAVCALTGLSAYLRVCPLRQCPDCLHSSFSPCESC